MDAKSKGNVETEPDSPVWSKRLLDVPDAIPRRFGPVQVRSRPPGSARGIGRRAGLPQVFRRSVSPYRWLSGLPGSLGNAQRQRYRWYIQRKPSRHRDTSPDLLRIQGQQSSLAHPAQARRGGQCDGSTTCQEGSGHDNEQTQCLRSEGTPGREAVAGPRLEGPVQRSRRAMPGLDEVPEVAVEIAEHRNRAVRLLGRRSNEAHALRRI
jgi:hypothetical protein